MFSTSSQQNTSCHFLDFLSAENAMNQLDRKLILSGRHRRVRREDAFFVAPIRYHHELGLACRPLRHLLIQELQREQT